MQPPPTHRYSILLISAFLGFALGGGGVLLWVSCSGPEPAAPVSGQIVSTR